MDKTLYNMGVMNLAEEVRRIEEAEAARKRRVDRIQDEIDLDAARTKDGIPLGQAIKVFEHPLVVARVDAAREEASRGWNFRLEQRQPDQP